MPWNGLRIRRLCLGWARRARIIGQSLALLMRIAMRLGRGSRQRPSEEESRGARRISDCHHLSVGPPGPGSHHAPPTDMAIDLSQGIAGRPPHDLPVVCKWSQQCFRGVN
jgi:hypothetical protein